MRSTWPKPHAAQMATALVDQAVAKVRRGPTSSRVSSAPGAPTKLVFAVRCGSNVSDSSQSSRSSSVWESDVPALSATLKHSSCVTRTSWIDSEPREESSAVLAAVASLRL